MGYVGSAQQVFDTGLYHLGGLFPLAFGLVAGAMGAATLCERASCASSGHATALAAGLSLFVVSSR